eukprot:TRINITY_DN27875_c0_g1_i1.p1 TRINITY_DN27875_c0_g1~~TRINITY_DN27875_c0_g1_i1.p1  ORF type:complete len:136 (-),score=35.75 TRINITY_DN27875_c0_g1_i1:182-589(-)
MGAAAPCQVECCEPPRDAEEEVNAALDGINMSHADFMKGDGVHLEGLAPELLEGDWDNEEDGMRMGRIEHGKVVWDPVFGHNSTPLLITWTGLEMELLGSLHRATLQAPKNNNDRLKLLWSDGQVWVLANRLPRK